MALTKPIPVQMREELANDPFMQFCCIADENCEGRIEWHHALIFKGSRVNEKWAILPACHYHHYHEAVYKEEFRKAMLSRATEEELEPYCKAINYIWYKRKYEQS